MKRILTESLFPEDGAGKRRIGIDACWCSEDDKTPLYGHADDHILGRRMVVSIGPSQHIVYPDTASNSKKGVTIHATF